MVEGAVQSLGTIAGGLLWKIAGGIGIVAFSVGLFYLIRFIQKGTKKQKAFTIRAVIEDMNGVIDFDKLGFVKSEESGLLEMQFQKRKQDSIPPIPKHLIKNGSVMLLNYAPAHYAVIDTYKLAKNIEAGRPQFENAIISLGMKKYLMSKQREIINKGEEKRRKVELYAPWITLGVAIIVVVLFAAFLLYMGVKLDAANVAARIAECRSAMVR